MNKGRLLKNMPTLKQALDGLFQVLDVLRAAYEVVAAVDEEEIWYCLNVVERQGAGIDALVLADANPGQRGCLLFPEMLVRIEADLIDLETL